jgi:hypothetical protein
MAEEEVTPGKGGGWVNIGQMHTVPEDEMHIHALAPNCACGPKLTRDDRVLMISHNSYDAREVNEKLGKLKLADT